MNVTEGSTFVLDYGIGSHLWAVISDPVKSDREIVIVNFTTSRNKANEDTACFVQKDDHPFIRQKSFIYYRLSQVRSLQELELWLKMGQLRPHKPLIPQLLEKIRKGAKETIFLPFGVERILSMQELI